jgi:hypothetical protein
MNYCRTAIRLVGVYIASWTRMSRAPLRRQALSFSSWILDHCAMLLKTPLSLLKLIIAFSRVTLVT